MKGFKGYLKVLLFILVCFVFQNINAQFSKTHYIPPLASINNGNGNPLNQYLYISTPNIKKREGTEEIIAIGKIVNNVFLKKFL